MFYPRARQSGGTQKKKQSATKNVLLSATDAQMWPIGTGHTTPIMATENTLEHKHQIKHFKHSIHNNGKNLDQSLVKNMQPDW